jgi:hypothetical protein
MTKQIMELHFWKGICDEPDKRVTISVNELMLMLKQAQGLNTDA